MKKRKIHTLSFDDSEEDIFYLSFLYLKNIEIHKLIYLINSHSEFNFNQADFFKLNNHLGTFIFFLYSYFKEDEYINIIQNKSIEQEIKLKSPQNLFETFPANSYISNKYKNYNFIIKKKYPDFSKFYVTLHKLDILISYLEVNSDDLKNKDNFMF